MFHRSTFMRSLLPLLVALIPSPATAQVTTGAVRGRVVSADGQPVPAAQVTVTNLETGTAVRAETGADGRYQVLGLLVGPYGVQVRRVGFAPLERRVRVSLGAMVDLDFQMAPAATAVGAVTVVGQAQPLIDRAQSGYVDLISETQVQAMPTNGRNFTDLVALSPAVTLGVGDGSGGNLSLGGGRRGANLIQIDGAGSTGTFFGGEARGSDRIPFAYSIEAVREFQVITNAYDVGYGFFAGGVVNAVTKSGTNELHGSVFGFLRHENLASADFSMQPAVDFKSLQVGGTLSGPIIRDKMHFYLSVERQDRNEPIAGLPTPGSTPDPRTGVHPDSVRRFLDILENVYGVTERAGVFRQTQDETSVFARVDWQVSDRHRLTLRHNYTDLDQQNDRISDNETLGNGGVFLNTGRSTVLSLHSLLGPTILNELRVQRATEPRPREAYSLLPQGRVSIVSAFGEGRFASIAAECCNDPVLPNSLEETTFEVADDLHIRRGAHALKLGVHLNRFSYDNFFFFNQQGEFRFTSLANFDSQVASQFSRALPHPGPDGQFFTPDDVRPRAVYDVNELALYAQDTWELSDRLQLTLGLRYDRTSFPDRARRNQVLFDTTSRSRLFDSTGMRTDVAPGDKNVSPRLGFTYALNPEARRLLRGGVGLFYGRFPAVLYSNALLNWGGNQLSLFCTGTGNVPTPDYAAYQADPSTIPTACRGGGGPSAPVANINLFAPDFEYPKILRLSLGYEHALTDRFKLGLDVLYAKTTGNFVVLDQNLLPTQFRSVPDNRSVLAPRDSIQTTGTVRTGANRRTRAFGEILTHTSTGQARTYQIVLSAEQRFGRGFSWQAAYTYSHTLDNGSESCCTSGELFSRTPTAGHPTFFGEPGNDLEGPWGPADFDRPHTLVLAGTASLPWGVEVSGIWRTTSGRPWTPIVEGDPNADGRLDNDRAYIGTNLTFGTPAVDTATLRNHINTWKCLKKQEFHIVARNSCRNPRVTSVDLRVRRAFRTRGTQRIELVADFFNVMNALHHLGIGGRHWGAPLGVTGDDDELLIVTGFDPATGTYRYSVNPSFGTLTDLTPFRTDQWQAQLGVRYSF